MSVSAALAKENLVCPAAMARAIVTLIVSMFVCVCVSVAGGPFRGTSHFRAAKELPQADRAGTATSHTACVPHCAPPHAWMCASMLEQGGRRNT